MQTKLRKLDSVTLRKYRLELKTRSKYNSRRKVVGAGASTVIYATVHTVNKTQYAL